MADKQYAIVLDTKKCLNCKACTVACKFENFVPVGDDTYRIWVTEMPLQGKFPRLHQEYQPSQCQHCENAPCEKVCPTKATFRTREGVVLVDYKKCILCKACMAACPYDARFVSDLHEAVEKCTFCMHRVSEGREPACVETCPTKVRVFGDMNDPASDAARLLSSRQHYQLKPEKNTRPRLFYLA
ncbi:MAG: 4Fe-4S dicluster domain-containing protein [Desulfobacterales bacterium]|jgi:Fe-S-cluster-containing dehydrogenase component|nr:4Fe-4S dicluster domain-containing protein [Desulfobacterales bacterium]